MGWDHVQVIEVRAWGARIGALAAGGTRRAYTFEYDPAWRRQGHELSPELMPTTDRRQVFSFPGLSDETFHGLPPMIADSLPDRFGNAIVDAHLAALGLAPSEATALDRLAYLGPRGMGALEFRPDQAPHVAVATSVDLAELIVTARAAVEGTLASESESAESLQRIINVGTSAGGARAKAILNFDPISQEIRSGHVPPARGFEPWLLKFDGVRTDQRLGPTENFGRVEYAYSLMAGAAGIDMAPTRLLVENGRAHFMTRRFDRDPDGVKVHLQTLCGLAGLDYNQVATHDYAQYLQRIEALGLGAESVEQGWRRMVFNVAAANCDDHTKNFSFLFRPGDGWHLAPAYDVTYAYNSESVWVHQHLMSVNGRFQDIRQSDVLTVADRFGVQGAKRILAEVLDAVAQWPTFAAQADVPAEMASAVAVDHRVGSLARA
ncbi:type II toxin-antitoxin system HipA family toxin [Pseudolysinimonas sp.]|uniref:type II toxin-antitoxin system HipA family toxin n=1 Tax=Pseudolysinimonas sp. TaxID=2680009 RepID=UPI00286C8A52|nr:type II toxin-antitoxin system HipA family toxin [Pseudolysinimonas sp.]